jgi:hypothetical protein
VIYGTAGENLKDGHTGLDEARRAAGRPGEVATATVLRQFEAVHPEVAVFNSLQVPSRTMTADIDHVVVAGNRVWLLDSKRWKPGFYWTCGSWHMRGLRKVPHAGRETMGIAARAVKGYLGPGAVVETPIVIVWPSRAKPLLLWAWRSPVGKGMTGKRFAASVGEIFRPAPADPTIVQALRRLVVGPGTDLGRQRGGDRASTRPSTRPPRPGS